MITTDQASLLVVLEENWQAEMKGYSAYLTLPQSEAEPQRRNTLRGLAAAERHHADLWAGRIMPCQCRPVSSGISFLT